MASQLLKRCMNRRTRGFVDIYIVTQTEAYRRSLQPGWETVKEEHIRRIEDEVEKLPADAKQVMIRDVFHKSVEDPREHITLDVKDENGNHIVTKHVTRDPAQQETSWSSASTTAEQHPVQQQQTESTTQWVWDEGYKRYRYWDGAQWVWQ